MYDYDKLHRFVVQVFSKVGFSDDHSAIAATALLRADLRGVTSHGIIRLSNYVRLIEQGRINPTPRVRVCKERTATALLDADRAIGAVVSTETMDLAIKKAKVTGSAWVMVRNSNHFGVAAHYTTRALDHGLIGIAMTNATPLVAPTYGAARQLGTNPISVAIPTGKRPPVVIDMATAMSSSGKIEEHKRTEKDLPLGWLQDAAGHPTSDPYDLEKGGALYPMGGEHSTHKGYCLSAWIDVFSGVLSGANFLHWVPPFVHYLEPKSETVGEGIGHAFAVIDPAAFVDDFYVSMDRWVDALQQTPAVENKRVLIPGEVERQNETHHLAHGLPLQAAHVQDLDDLAVRLGVKKLHRLDLAGI